MAWCTVCKKEAKETPFDAEITCWEAGHALTKSGPKLEPMCSPEFSEAMKRTIEYLARNKEQFWCPKLGAWLDAHTSPKT